MVAQNRPRCYNARVSDATDWVLLAYRLPREPSTPRIALWRKLRQLGVVQLIDGLVALPRTPETREQLEWLAESVAEAGGGASVWLAQPAAAAEGRTLVATCNAARAEEYRVVLDAATAAREQAPALRRRAMLRLRRELRRVRARDYFAAPGRAEAEAAVDALAAASEVAP